MTARREFPLSVRKAAFARADGVCECGCGQPFTDHPKERPVYDHRVPDALGGEPTLENCRCIRKCCHDVETFRAGGDITKIAKAKRGERQRQGLAPKRRGFLTNKDGPWKARLGKPAERRN